MQLFLINKLFLYHFLILEWIIYLIYEFLTRQILARTVWLWSLNPFNCQVIRAGTFNQDGSGFISDRMWFSHLAEWFPIRNDSAENSDDPNPIENSNPSIQDEMEKLPVIVFADSELSGCTNNKFL